LIFAITSGILSLGTRSRTIGASLLLSLATCSTSQEQTGEEIEVALTMKTTASASRMERNSSLRQSSSFGRSRVSIFGSNLRRGDCRPGGRAEYGRACVCRTLRRAIFEGEKTFARSIAHQSGCGRRQQSHHAASQLDL